MTTLLKQIIDNKIVEIREKKKPVVNFAGALIHPRIEDMVIIAEIKLATPAGGELGKTTEVVKRAKDYEQAGADLISVVVDKKYFHGDINFITDIKKNVALPVLMKDFILDPYQIFEAKFVGADSTLLIAKLLTKKKLQEYVLLSKSIGLEPVVEVEDEFELDKVLATKALCIAVNARNLTNFQVDINRACKLMRLIPKEKLALGFSGVRGRREVEKYKEAGAKAILVGTALMRNNNIRRFITKLKG